MRILINEQKDILFQAGEELPKEKDNLWLITNGVVKTHTVSEGGALITLGFWGEGDVIGKSLSNVDPYIIKCISDVQAIAVRQEY
ncbi:MAG: hypothetical protein ACRC06_15735, partial [Waterburya sp.]